MVERILHPSRQLFVRVAAGVDEGGVGVGQAALQVGGGDDGLAVFQDGFVAGPELGLDVNLPGGFTVRPKVAYDYQFRNSDWDEGILWGGLDLGIRF